MSARTVNTQRLGLFSYPMGLTVGDSSSYYDCPRRPAEEIGRLKGFLNSRGKKSTTDTFGKL
jgi:hypothetical protein